MSWLNDLLWSNSIAHTVLLLAFVIAAGIFLGKIKIGGISLGMTLVLFVGIAVSHFGFRMDHDILHFVKEFGLILFVYAVGLQVGPGFFASFKKGGITLNMLACGIVLLGAVTTLVIHYATGISISTMVGIMSGAVTNTPGLGAAQQAYTDMNGQVDDTIALGYAVAYPLGVVGIILSMLLVRFVFRVNLKMEAERLTIEDNKQILGATPVSLLVKNPAIFGKRIADLAGILDHREFVISRILYAETQKIEIASADSVLHENDKIFVITTERDVEAIKVLVGEAIHMDRKQWIPAESQLISRRIVVTKHELNGKRLGDLQLRRLYGINITRINRSGIDLVATPSLKMQIGDRLTVVGSDLAVKKVEELLGNSERHLNEPNLIMLFVGIGLGILLGSFPIYFPGIPQPVKLGLAGGPLIVAILLGRFGYQYKLITYTTQSANLMIREIGIALFLACVGLGAGDGFVDTIVNKGGYTWIGYGFIITLVPLLVIGCIGRFFCKLNYFTLTGLMAGSMTDPPALSYATAIAGNDAPAVGYATVYPITMFLRILAAQLLILFFCV